MPYIDPDTVARARETDLLTFLQERDPDELVRDGPQSWHTRTHDSLKLSNGKWYWWSRGIGGRSALDYLIEVRGLSFTDAVREVVGDAERPPAARRSPAPQGPSQSKPKKFRAPSQEGTEAAMRYLARRGISREIISALSSEGAIYGNRRYGHQNVVFLGRDSAERPRYAAIRSCGGDFKGEAAGSDKRFSFSVEQRGGPVDVHVFESAIDALSFATLRSMAGDDWRAYSLLSLGGIPPMETGRGCKVPDALSAWLDGHPLCSEVHLHLDNDEPGRAASRAIAEALSGRVPVSIEPPAVGKDVNDWLLAVAGSRSGPQRGTDRGAR